MKHYRPGTAGMPGVLTADCQVAGINDQHAHMTFPANMDLQMGDMIALGVSHPCTTFDKWRLIPVIADHTHADPAIVDFIHTFF